jgi:thiamine monophosphate kinase
VSNFKRIESARDVALIRMDSRNVLVVSCDSAGAIGPNSVDALRVDAATVGKFTTRVALMEAVAVGARPVCVSVTLCVEPIPRGHEIIRGVRRELQAAKLGDVRIVQSSEKNFSVRQTGVGVTVGGIAQNQDLRVGKCRRGDLVIAIGRPCVGYEVLRGERAKSIAGMRDVNALLELRFVHEIIPVGSKGILKEARIIAADSGLRFLPKKEATIDMSKSAGPATVVLCAIVPARWPELQEIIHKPLSFVGELR